MGLHYTGAPVDRADALRKDARQVDELWRRDTTLLVPCLLYTSDAADE